MHRATGTNVRESQGSRITGRDRRDFAKGMNLLNGVLERVMEYEPDAGYYLAMETLNLMVGPTHEGTGPGLSTARPENVALAHSFIKAGGGDW